MIDNYDKLPLGKWYMVMDILTGDDEPINKHIDLICVLGDYDREYVENLPISKFKALSDKIEFLKKPIDKTGLPKDTYKLGGRKLELHTKVDKMTVAQYADYQAFIKEGDKYLAELVCVFLIPQGCNYNDGYDLTEIHQLVRDELSIQEVKNISAFFLLLSQSLIKGMLTYSIRKMKRMAKKMTGEEKAKMMEAIASLENAGAGFRQLTE